MRERGEGGRSRAEGREQETVECTGVRRRTSSSLRAATVGRAMSEAGATKADVTASKHASTRNMIPVDRQWSPGDT